MKRLFIAHFAGFFLLVFGLSPYGTLPVWGQDDDAAADGSNDSDGIAVNYLGWAEKYREVAEAVEKYRKRDLNGAVELLDTAIDKYSELPPTELILAEMFWHHDQRDRAIRALDSAAKLHPGDPETYLLLGNLAFQENRNTEAILSYDKAADLMETFQGDTKRVKRNTLRLSAGLASVAERYGDWEEALVHLKMWVELDEKNAHARVRYARALFRNNKGKEAHMQLQLARRFNNNILPAPIMIAQFFLEQNNVPLAKQWLASAEEQFGNDINTLIVLANFNWQNGQFEEAKRHALAAVDLEPSNTQANLVAGRVAHYDHDFAAATGYFDDVHKKEPENLLARNHLAMALIADGTKETLKRAVKLAASTNRSVPDDPEALTIHGYALFKSGDKDEAGKMFKQAAKGRRNGNMNYIFAHFLSSEGKVEEAVPFLEEGLGGAGLFVFRRDAEKLYGKLAKLDPEEDPNDKKPEEFVPEDIKKP